MDDITVFAKDEKEVNIDTNKKNIGKVIGMEDGTEIMSCWQWKLVKEEEELNCQVRNVSERQKKRETYKYLEILEDGSIKQRWKEN